jgi:chloride channel 7
VALVGAFVTVLTDYLVHWKWESCYKLIEDDNFIGGFFALQFFCFFYSMVSGSLCWRYPQAAGSGIPELIAFLNGVDIKGVVSLPVLVTKALSCCFATAAGLPLGREGPMIHSGAIIGGMISQGFPLNAGYDTSWNTFQDLRNDYTKRDFATFGAAAGVAAAFRAPIGGILFTLEEAGSFWSTSTTFRSFICAVITQLTIGILFPEKATDSAGMFALGQFENLFDGRSNFYVYEIPLFIAIGCLGGVLGALFNHLNLTMNLYRIKHINASKWKRMGDLCFVTLLISFCGFMFPFFWRTCTPRPEPQSYNTRQEINLLNRLVSFQCHESQYNQLASIFFVSPDDAMRQLFHFREVNGEGLNSLTSGPLILFFIPYFLIASITTGVMAPSGFFVPTLLSGAAVGRLIGHWMNMTFPGSVADSGTYALIGGAAVMGGLGRMTISGCVIVLEACGNITYLLPLMLTFAAARYSGNIFNPPIFEIQIHLKGMPFLADSLHSFGMLNYHPISHIMTQPVITLMEIERVGRVVEILNTTSHNGFPVVNRDGRLRGLILRKTLCSLLKLKAYATPTLEALQQADGGIPLAQASNVGYDAIERTYPNYPDVTAVKLDDKELVRSISHIVKIYNLNVCF